MKLFQKVLTLLFALLLFSPIVAFSLDPAKAITQYGHDNWQSDEGLPANTIRSIVQTPDGYIWLATHEGLSRFDGVQFTLFSRQNTKGLRNNDILTLAVDRTGVLWLGTNGGGAYRFENGEFTAITTADGVAGDSVWCLLADTTGNVWIGTNEGLSRWNSGKIQSFTMREGLVSNSIRALYEDRDGNIWVGTYSGGLHRYVDGKFVLHATNPELTGQDVTCIFQDSRGDFWIGTRRGGLQLLRDKTSLVYREPEGLPYPFVLSITEDRDANLWITTRGGGLSRFRNGAFENFDSRKGLSNDVIRTVFEDREGSLWLGTDGGGLNRLRDGKVTPFTELDGLSSNQVWSIAEHADKSLWFGTDGGGLSILRDGKFSKITTTDGLLNDFIWAIATDSKGGVWSSSYSAGLNYILNGKITHFTTLNGLSSDLVYSITPDREGNVWIGTDGGGLNMYRDGKFVVYSTAEGLPSNTIWSILEDRNGGLWLGTRGGGLSFFQNGKFQNYSLAQGLTSDQVWALYQDPEGTLWVGTNGGGLHRWKNGRFTPFPNIEQEIYSILEDEKGNLWMSSNNGILRASLKQLNQYADRQRSGIAVLRLGKADGMKTAECTGGVQPPATKTSDGRLWFSTVHGVVAVDPTNVPTNEIEPPVLIEKVIADEDVILSVPGSNQLLSVAPGQKKLEFHYAGLSFLAPEKVKFKYKLEGFDSNWVDPGTRRVAFYTQIPPGRYVFRVLACNNDSVWSQNGAALHLLLRPRYYQTWWFLLTCVGTALLALGVAYNIRRRSIQRREQLLVSLIEQRTQDLSSALTEAEKARQEAEKQKTITEEALLLAQDASRSKTQFLATMSHELRTPLNAILGYEGILEDQLEDIGHPEMLPDLQKIQAAGKHLLGMINDILDISRIETGKLELATEEFGVTGLIKDLAASLQAAAHKNGNLLEVQLASDLGTMRGDAVRVRQILWNLVHNAIKFTENGAITVNGQRVAEGDRELVVVRVQDTGIGIAQENLHKLFQPFLQVDASTTRKYEGTGLGLTISQRLAKIMGGDITVESQPGKGSTFTLTLPVAPLDTV